MSENITTDDGTVYEPWTDGYAVGYKVTRPDGAVRYIYLNPSDHGLDDVPNVFVYIGDAGKSEVDSPAHHYTVWEEGEEGSASEVSYSVELGVNVPGQRLCVGEIGPFRSATQALIESAALIGKTVPQVEGRRDFSSFSETVPPGTRIAGFTVNRYDDDNGTDWSWLIHGEGRALKTETLT